MGAYGKRAEPQSDTAKQTTAIDTDNAVMNFLILSANRLNAAALTASGVWREEGGYHD